MLRDAEAPARPGGRASLPVREAPLGRSRPAVKRASAGLSLVRIVAALVLLGAAAALQRVTVAPEFTLGEQGVTIEGARYTDETAVRAQLGIVGDARPNLFRLRSDELAGAVGQLPAVAAAEVSIVLPDRLAVTIEERRPILVWRVGASRYLVDAAGTLFADVPAGARLPEESPPLPEIVDARPPIRTIALGDRLDETDFAAVRQLGALTPALLGSAAERLQLTIQGEDGFVLTAPPQAWRAVFGHYTPTLRKPEVIDSQVRCLVNLLAGGEDGLRTVYLVPSGERCGTFVARPRASEPASESPRPRRSPRP